MNGDSAIYGSSPWTYQNDSSNGNVWYTKKGENVYGISLGWPEDDVLKVTSPKAVKGATKISMVGMPGELEYDSERDSKSKEKTSFSSFLKLMKMKKCRKNGGI